MPLVVGWNHVCYTGTEQPIPDASAGFIDDVAAVYRLRADQGFDCWFAGRPKLSTIATVRPYEPLFILISDSAVWAQQPSMLPARRSAPMAGSRLAGHLQHGAAEQVRRFLILMTAPVSCTMLIAP